MSETTVIIPSYNQQNEAICAIQSVFSQTMSCELIVIDDCSTPPLVVPDEICQKGKITVIRLSKNQGAAAARNVGIEACKTDWLTFLDSDDQFLPGTLDSRLQFAKEALNLTNDGPNDGPGIENTFFCCGWIDPDQNEGNPQIRIPNPANSPEEFASGCWYSPGSCALFHRSFFEVEGRRYDEDLRRLEDFDWGIRVGLSGGQMVSHPIAGVSIQPSNNTNIKGIKVASAQILEKFFHLQGSQQKVYTSLSAYLALEQTTFSVREYKWLSAAFSIVRSFIILPRLKRHFSPGWTYENYVAQPEKTRLN